MNVCILIAGEVRFRVFGGICDEFGQIAFDPEPLIYPLRTLEITHSQLHARGYVVEEQPSIFGAVQVYIAPGVEFSAGYVAVSFERWLRDNYRWRAAR